MSNPREQLITWRADHERFLDMTTKLVGVLRRAIGEEQYREAMKSIEDYGIHTHDITKIVEEAIGMCEVAKIHRKMCGETLRKVIEDLEENLSEEFMDRRSIKHARKIAEELENE